MQISTVTYMSPAFKRVYRASGYCRTVGVLGARSKSSQVLVPVDLPVKAKVRAVEGAGAPWSSKDNPEWAELAEKLWKVYAPEVEVSAEIIFDKGFPVQHHGYMIEEAAVIAAVTAVTSAVEVSLDASGLTRAEAALWLPTGLAHGTPVRTRKNGESEVLDWNRYRWVWARGGVEGAGMNIFGDVRGAFPGGFVGESEAVSIFQESNPGCLFVLGGVSEGDDMAALYPMDTNLADLGDAVKSSGKALGREWLVHTARSSVPTAERPE